MVCCFANQKGGVGKTTTVFTMGNILASQNKKVLMIDMDPQSSLTISCGLKNRLTGNNKLGGMLDVLCGGAAIEDIVMSVCGKENLFLAPANINLARAEMALVPATSRENILRNAIRQARDAYDYVLIDCQPSLGLLVINSLTASDGVIVPVASDYLSYEGLRLISESIEEVQKKLNPALRFIGVVVTFCLSTLHSKEVLELLHKQYRVIGEISTSTKVKDSILNSKSIFDEMPNHQISKQYLNLTEVFANG